MTTMQRGTATAPSAPNYDRTVVACFVGYVTQAVINNFMPLLFVTFATTLGIGMARLSALITINFVTQLVVDVLAGKFVDRIGYKPCILAAHVAALAGLLVLGLLPVHVPDPYPAIVAAVFLYAVGGGTLMFALLAVAGDLGCTSGPAVVGFVASANGDDLKT